MPMTFKQLTLLSEDDVLSTGLLVTIVHDQQFHKDSRGPRGSPFKPAQKREVPRTCRWCNALLPCRSSLTPRLLYVKCPATGCLAKTASLGTPATTAMSKISITSLGVRNDESR